MYYFLLAIALILFWEFILRPMFIKLFKKPDVSSIEAIKPPPKEYLYLWKSGNWFGQWSTLNDKDGNIVARYRSDNGVWNGWKKENGGYAYVGDASDWGSMRKNILNSMSINPADVGEHVDSGR